MGGTSVGVGGTSVGVGGTSVGVLVGRGVLVGTSVGVLVGRGVLVGTSVGVLVGRGVLVGTGVSVGVRVGACVGALVGMGVGVWSERRGFLVSVGVKVKNRLAVAVVVGESVAVGASVSVGTRVAVGTNTVTACSVRAATVSRFETAKSMTFNGSIVIKCWALRSPIATAETLQSRLTPIAAAPRTPKGPAYSLAFTLVALL